MAEQEQLAEVIPLFGRRRTERIAGIKINLGRMTLPELEDLADNCQARLGDAEADVMIVTDHIEGRREEEAEVSVWRDDPRTGDL